MDSQFASFDALLQGDDMSVRVDQGAVRFKLINLLDEVMRQPAGIAFLSQRALKLEQAGLFEHTVWANPEQLVPALVRGTMFCGHPTSTLEIMSDLRMLAHARDSGSLSHGQQVAAQEYCQNVLVHNLDLAFKEPTEEARLRLSKGELDKISGFFGFLLEAMDFATIQEILAAEVAQICSQRPVMTKRANELIRLAHRNMTQFGSDRSPSADLLVTYVQAIYQPSVLTAHAPTPASYLESLKVADTKAVQAECAAMSQALGATGLVSPYHAVLLRHLLSQQFHDLVPRCLNLREAAIAEWREHEVLITKLCEENIIPANAQAIYGLSQVINRGLFGNAAVATALQNLRKLKLHPNVIARIRSAKHPDCQPRQHLIGALLRVLGQPLGIGQGNNPTCQSARGISLWSQYAPAKLINLVSTAASQDNLTMRFEGREISSQFLTQGLVHELDTNLDTVSLVLVPHLDKIYQEMMRLAAGRGEDPHKWVNPAFYGDWIQIDFASAYDYGSDAIYDYMGFLRIFYRHFHLKYNGGRHMVYPNPVGIFLTSSSGTCVGFHAVSLLRVDYDAVGELRAYFLNPNNDSRQDWGQGIKPEVQGNKEQPGESSLPFLQFAARIYAFHYNHRESQQSQREIPKAVLEQVTDLAKASWGTSYTWVEGPRQWLASSV